MNYLIVFLGISICLSLLLLNYRRIQHFIMYGIRGISPEACQFFAQGLKLEPSK
jgi:hypothetical protein